MSNLTSSLTLKLVDDGLAAKAKADAEALRKLGASGDGLKKLSGASANIKSLVKELDGLALKGQRLDGLGKGADSLRRMGEAARAARAEVGKTAAALAKKQGTLDYFDKVKGNDPRRYAKWQKDGLVKTVEANARAAVAAHEKAQRALTKAREASVAEAHKLKAAYAEAGLTGGRGGVAAAQMELATATGRANRALAQQHSLVARAAANARAEGRVAGGMGAAGRRQMQSSRVAAGMSAAGRAAAAPHAEHFDRAEARAHAAEERERQRHMRNHGIVGAAGATAAGYVSAHSIGHGVVDTVKVGARYQHEVTALQNAGRDPHEMEEIEAASRATTKKLPTASYEENLKVVNETTGAFGSLHHAIENLPFMQKSASVLHSAAGDKIQEGAGELGNLLARFFEERQVAGDTPTFQREAEGLVRAMAFSRGNFNPREALNFAQQAKSALPNYSEHYLTRIAPSLITMMGGDRAGTASNAFNSVITGKVNDKKQAEEWLKYGLLDKRQTVMKAGHAIGWRAGAVKDTDTALSNPLKWAEETALPAMRAKGVNVDDRMELTKALATMFRNSNSNVFANAMMQAASRQRFHKDDELIGKAGTLDQIYDRNLKTDPTAAVTGLTASLDNLMTVASSPAMQAAAQGLTTLAGGLNTLADFGKDHPAAAMAAGAGVAGGALAGAGFLTYQLMNGFGLGTSAAALDASAAALTAAAAKIGGGTVAQTAATTAASVGAGAAVAVGALGATVAAGGIGASVLATEAVKNRDFANPYMDGGMLGADPAGYGFGAAIANADTLPGAPHKSRGSLPPGAAGMPAPALPRLPGLDGRQSEVGAIGQKADEAKGKLDAVNATTVAPQVDAGSLRSLLATANELLATLKQIPGAVAGANTGLSSVGALRGRTSFSDGVTPGAGAQ